MASKQKPARGFFLVPALRTITENIIYLFVITYPYRIKWVFEMNFPSSNPTNVDAILTRFVYQEHLFLVQVRILHRITSCYS